MTMIDYIHWRRGDAETPTGRAYLRIQIPASLNDSFKAVYESVTFLGDRKFMRKDGGAWHISVTAPRMVQCWMAKVSDTNECKKVFGSLQLAASPGYRAPAIEILELKDKRLFIKVQPQGALFQYREVLSELFVYCKTAFSFHGYISLAPLDPQTAIVLLNEHGFDVSLANVRRTALVPKASPDRQRATTKKKSTRERPLPQGPAP
mmetsp:Transcript_13996/g.42326  ORF Transcript_13996/g.42326 Transcript_13996/m.42326 type:complete len:206 (-) Transcript_13996:219-836(-)